MPPAGDQAVDDLPPPSGSSEGRVAFWAFVVATLAAVPIILYAGRNQFFFIDEWVVLTLNPIGLDDIFYSHNGHPTTLGVVSYQTLYALFGVRTYLPYQLLVVASHLAVVVLGRATMIRLGVSPWISTLCAASLLLFGAGALSVVWAFQVTFNAAIVALLAALLLTASDRRDIGRHDVLAVAVLVAGTTTSNVIVPMVGGLAAGLWLRRGWRVAAFHAGVPALVYCCWFVLFGENGSRGWDSFAAFGEFASRQVWAVATGVGGNPLAAVIVAGVIGGGGAFAVRRRDTSDEVARLSIVVILTSAYLGFVVTTSVTRHTLLPVLPDLPTADRYVYVGAVLLMPVFALGVDRLRRLHPAAAGGALLALAVGIPSNVDALFNRSPFGLGNPDVLAALAASEFLDEGPEARLVGPPDRFAPFLGMTVGWLRSARDDGKVDAQEQIEPSIQLHADLLLAVSGHGDSDTPMPCEPIWNELDVELDVGDLIGVSNAESLVLRDQSGARSFPLDISRLDGSALEVVAGPIQLEATVSTPADDAGFCVIQARAR